jgi:hypothetical protein
MRGHILAHLTKISNLPDSGNNKIQTEQSTADQL